MEGKKINKNELNEVNGGCSIIELDEGPRKTQLLTIEKLRTAAMHKATQKRVNTFKTTLKINSIVNKLLIDCSNKKEIEDQLNKYIDSLHE